MSPHGPGRVRGTRNLHGIRAKAKAGPGNNIKKTDRTEARVLRILIPAVSYGPERVTAPARRLRTRVRRPLLIADDDVSADTPMSDLRSPPNQ